MEDQRPPPSFELLLWRSPHPTHVSRLAYHPQRSIERALVLAALKASRKRRYEVWSLLSRSEDRHYGLLVSSRRRVSDRESLVIELLFTSCPYRKLTYSGLDPDGPVRVSHYLILHAIRRAVERGCFYVALQPLQQSEERLVPLYEESGFSLGASPDEEGWMFLELSSDPAGDAAAE